MQVSTLGDITNAESQSLQVGLAIQDDATKAGADSFGDGKKEYTTGINIQFAQGQALFSRIKNSTFDQHSVAPRSEIEFLRTSKLSQRTTVGGLSPASFHMNPANHNSDISSLGLSLF